MFKRKRVMKLYPFDEVVANAKRYMARGANVCQQWNCEHCGVQQTVDVPNTFYKSGTCKKCKKITDIYSNGTNLMIPMATRITQ
jgi:hypothetical protein